jgi:hypothetical protein
VIPDLHGADLSGADLSGADMRKVDMKMADLSWTNLTGADLSEADLYKAFLVGAVLTEANLNGANLSAAMANYANLTRADFSNADLRGITLFETSFGDTNLRDAKGLESCWHYGPSTLDFRTLTKSGPLPLFFLRGCGLPESLIAFLPSLLNQSIEFYSCFISYSHANKSFAHRLHGTLQGRGIRCWLDEHQLLPGDDIYDQVDRGIRLWDKVLLCCSKESLTSWWVDDEIGKAFEKERRLVKERDGKRTLALIPLVLDDHLLSGKWESGMATQVKRRLAADFTGWEHDNAKFDAQVERVISALKTGDAGREAPPPVSKL